ncbi:monovalent cation/H(+) antiporter subunit G [Virgibacillus flavescens]|uniref:monovalent cation/H(+) antiporter subunit G n=1 Tax=Virgibacillus flavescens TaxID=1611422 RepID=UPI003D340FC5
MLSLIETWTDIVLNVLTSLFILAGTFFILSGAIGVLRFPDVYTRLHAATKASTLGIAGILIGAFIFLYVGHGLVSGKLLLAIIFTFLTAPVSAHMISRAAHRKEVKPLTFNKNDEYEESFQRKESLEKK